MDNLYSGLNTYYKKPAAYHYRFNGDGVAGAYCV